MFHAEANLALKSFIAGIVSYSALGVLNEHYGICNTPWIVTTIFLLIALLMCTVLKLLYNGNDFQIAIRAALLGSAFAIGLYLRLVAAPSIKIFGPYLSVMAFFHFSEFFAIASIQSKEVTTDSFVINHSPQYIIAAVASWVEFFIESYFFPGLKQIYWLSNVGLGICIMGETLRKISMLTAGSNFNHLVQCQKNEDHVLITHGVYAFFRHPSYVGWFYWSVGTQLILLNPICIPAYVLASWYFFKTRIYIEEITLLNFFGQSYCDYQRKVGTGLPFIEGYKI